MLNRLKAWINAELDQRARRRLGDRYDPVGHIRYTAPQDVTVIVQTLFDEPEINPAAPIRIFLAAGDVLDIDATRTALRARQYAWTEPLSDLPMRFEMRIESMEGTGA